MQVFTEFNRNPNLSLAFGFFDGVHQGHRCVVKNAVNVALQNNATSAVITFANSPKSFFTKNESTQIITTEEKLSKLEKLGVDCVYLLNFNEKIANLTAKEYLKEKIIKNFFPIAITTGFNHTLGKDCATGKFLSQIQSEFNFKYFEIPPITWDSKLISTSSIKYLIENANFSEANALLGYNFFIEGKVIEGNKIGRTIQFPTANVLHPKEIIQFPKGVYCAKAEVNGILIDGVLNYGQKPTISDENTPLHEIHIFDFNNDIYGQKIKILPLKKIRDEQKFSSLEELKNRITVDTQIAKEFFKQQK